MNNLYQTQGQWPNQMHHQPSPGGHQNAFAPSNVNSQPYAQGFQPTNYMPSGQMPGQGYSGYYNQGYSRGYGNDGSYGGRAPNPAAPLYNQGPPSQGPHHKKHYSRPGNNHNFNNGSTGQQYNTKQNYNKKSSFGGFEAPSDFNPNMSQYKQRNIELPKRSQAATAAWSQAPKAAPAQGTAAGAADWSSMLKRMQATGAPALKKRDRVKEALGKLDVSEEAEVDRVKNILNWLKDSKDGKEVVVPKDDEKKETSAEKNEDGAEKSAAEAADKDADSKEKEAETAIDREPTRKRREGAINL